MVMGRNLYQLYCNFCNFKRLTDGTDVSDLKEIPRSGVLKGTVQQNKNFSLDKNFEPTEEYLKKTLSQIKQFRCPKCGFAITAKKITKKEKPADE